MFLEKAYIGKNHWGWYVLTLLIVFLATQIASIPLLVYMALMNPESLMNTSAMAAATSTNTGLALTLTTFAGGFFALFYCVKHIQSKQYSDIVTGRSRVDYRRILFGAGVWAALMIGSLCVELMIASESEYVFQFEPLRFFGFVVVALLFFPFQTSFEELLFRGYLMQGFGILFRYRWIPFVLTSVIFGLMHASNPEVKSFGMWVAMPQYILMGLILGYVAIKDDGLELALGMHMANNIISSLSVTSSASAIQTPALFVSTTPEASHMDTLVMLIFGAIFIAICNRKYHFMKKVNLWGKIDKESYLKEQKSEEDVVSINQL